MLLEFNIFFKIEPEISDDRCAYIDDWSFEYWPNKPKSEIVKNLDGTFSVFMEKDFVPLVRQLQNLFEDGNAPENGTYLGEAVLTGKNEPLDCIYGNFINENWGLVISNRLLNLMKKYSLPEHYLYELPLLKKRKIYPDYNYLYFKKSAFKPNYDIQLFEDTTFSSVCVSEKLMDDILKSGMKGCHFTPISIEL